MLKLSIVRFALSEKTSIAVMTAAGAFQCFTLEDKTRPDGEKVPGETAIPLGRYNVEITWSEKFKRPLPLIWNTLLPDGRKIIRSADGRASWEGVRFHAGNGPEDTLACVLTGSTFSVDHVEGSVKAFDAFFAKLEVAGGKAILEVSIAPALL